MSKHDRYIQRLASLFGGVIELVDSKRVNCGPDFGWTEEVERDWLTVREEFNQFPRNFHTLQNFHELSTAQTSITNDNLWKVFVLKAFGIKAAENCKCFPQTDKLLSQIPGVTSVMFSFLGPNKHIPIHCGPYKGVLRLLLPIRMPKDRKNCFITIEGQRYEWEEGKCFVFDDCLYHEVHNNTNEVRVALFVDFYRPLPFPLNIINKLVYSCIMKTELAREVLTNLRQNEDI